MPVLADTSIWVEFLRRGRGASADRLERLLAGRDVVTCGPALAEILAGTPPPQRATVAGALVGLPWLEIDRAAWMTAGELANDLAVTGRTVPLVDVLVAVAAVRADAELWSRDHDFRRVKEALPRLRLYGEGDD